MILCFVLITRQKFNLAKQTKTKLKLNVFVFLLLGLAFISGFIKHFPHIVRPFHYQSVDHFVEQYLAFVYNLASWWKIHLFWLGTPPCLTSGQKKKKISPCCQFSFTPCNHSDPHEKFSLQSLGLPANTAKLDHWPGFVSMGGTSWFCLMCWAAFEAGTENALQSCLVYHNGGWKKIKGFIRISC